MGISRRSFAFSLAMTPGIGGKSVARILARNDLLRRAPEDFWGLSIEAYREEYRLNAKAAQQLLTTRASLGAITDVEHHLGSLGVQLVVATDAHFPTQVEMFDPDPPAALFYYGNVSLLDRPTFSVLSSRDASPSQLRSIEKITEEAVLSGKILVSGHDRQEYQRSAVVPLRWGSPRILCLDRGMFQVLGHDLKNEAFRAARLWRYEFDPQTDLVISPFRPDAGFSGVNNQVRDRLIAGFSSEIHFVKISPGGMMEKILRMGLKANRRMVVGPEVERRAEYLAAGAECSPSIDA